MIDWIITTVDDDRTLYIDPAEIAAVEEDLDGGKTGFGQFKVWLRGNSAVYFTVERTPDIEAQLMRLLSTARSAESQSDTKRS